MSKGYLDASSFHVPCLYYEPRSEGESSFAQIRSSIPGKCEEPRRKTLAKTNTALSLSLLRALHCRSASNVPKTDFMTEQKAYPIWFWRRDERFRVYP